MSDSNSSPQGTSRRDFLKEIAAVSAVAMISFAPLGAQAQQQSAQPAAAGGAGGSVPWYRRAHRWGQTNITEIDPIHYDIEWWRAHWKRTALNGIIANAGGIVAYYPSKYPLHHRASGLGNGDLFGDLTKAAHDDGLFVFARMDSSKCYEPFYQAHPDWFAVNANGQPYRSGEYYLTCVNSPYYDQYMPDIFREVIERSHPDGVTDNIWHGLDRTQICYCANCTKKFKDLTGLTIPTAHDWNDAGYRKWIQWNYDRRIELWENNNKVTRAAGGKDCIWVGMNGSGINGGGSFRDMKEICARTEMILLDSQSRSATGTFHENAEDGKIIHGLLGWDKITPESMAMYQHGRPQYRFSAKPAVESRQWMIAGIAGGISPWWHHVGANVEDARAYKIAEPVLQWHKANETYLANRKPVANVGVLWSQRNSDYYGRDNAGELVDSPWRGFTQAMVRARIPYLPVNIDHLERDAGQLKVLVLSNYGAISDAQAGIIRDFVKRGGSLIATGQSTLFNEWGEPRPDFALADLLGVAGGKPINSAPRIGRGGGAGLGAATERHTYLRLTPSMRAAAYGPKSPDMAAAGGPRHPILAGFDDTDILAFGSILTPSLKVNPGSQVLLTFIPEFVSTPPEEVIMRQASTDIPALVINESSGGRVAFLPADIDRRFAADNMPDHGDLLANTVRWAAGDTLPLGVQGPGLINCELYQQEGRMILHLVNLTSSGTWRAPAEELISVGPLRVSIRPPAGMNFKQARMLVSGGQAALTSDGGLVRFEVASVADHEVVVLET